MRPGNVTRAGWKQRNRWLLLPFVSARSAGPEASVISNWKQTRSQTDGWCLHEENQHTTFLLSKLESTTTKVNEWQTQSFLVLFRQISALRETVGVFAFSRTTLTRSFTFAIESIVYTGLRHNFWFGDGHWKWRKEQVVDSSARKLVFTAH